MFVNGPPATATYTLSLHDALPISFGTWTVDEASKTITVRNVGSMFPNQAGTEGKRIVVSVTADELRSEKHTSELHSLTKNVYHRLQEGEPETISLAQNTVLPTRRS